MKKILLLIFCLFRALISHADTEPTNDSPSGADPLAQNGSTSGTTTAGNFDFYELITTGDGDLTVTLDATTSSSMEAYLYDSSGTQYLGSVSANSGSGPVSFTIYQLGAGKYYLATLGNGTDSYTLSNSVDLLNIPNDAEPNDTYSTALPIAADDSTRGHLTYRNPDNTYDSNDYYILTTPVDGDITVTISNNNGNNIYISLIDSTGQIYMGGGGGAGGGSFTNAGLAAGNYYIRVFSNLSPEYSGYNLSYHLNPTAYQNDAEPNDVFSNAIALNVNDSTTGHLMHRLAGGNYDLRDWYQIVTTSDGNLTLSIYNSTNSYIGIALYDNTGATLIINNGGLGQSGVSLTAGNLLAGTYFVKVDANLTTEFCGYILRNHLSTTGINELTSLTGLNVFPNPATDEISINYKNGLSGVIKFKIINLIGSACFEKTINSPIGDNIISIPVENLNDGVYILQIISGTQTRQIQFTKE